jgi:hypothetical protein
MHLKIELYLRNYVFDAMKTFSIYSRGSPLFQRFRTSTQRILQTVNLNQMTGMSIAF